MSAVAPVSIDQRQGLNTIALMAALAALVIAIYPDTFASMAAVWMESSSYGHGLAIFPISAYLLWRLRSVLASVPLRSWPLGIALVGGLVLLWFVSRAVGVQAGEHLAVVLLIPATIATCMGLALARRALFPLMFLLAAVPVGDAIVPILMDVTADMAAALLRLVGVPSYRNGQFLSLPGGEFEVADVCSGLRSLIAGAVIATLASYLMYRFVWKRVAFVAGTAVVLVLVNGVRAFIVMWVASATDMRLLAGRDHVYFGWVLFAIAISALLWAGSKFVDQEAARGAATRGGGGTPEPDAVTLRTALMLGLVMLILLAIPSRQQFGLVWWLLPAGAIIAVMSTSTTLRAAARPTAATLGRAIGRSRTLSALIMVAATLLAGPLLLMRWVHADSTTAAVAFPDVDGCDRSAEWGGGWQPSWSEPDFRATGSYRCNERRVNVFVAGYAHSAQGQELIGVNNQPYPAAWRQFVERDAAQVMMRGQETTIEELRVDGGEQHSVIWYWYVVGDRAATSPFAVKLLQAWDVLKGGGGGGTVFWIETPLEPVLDESRARLAKVAEGITVSRTSSIGLRQ